MTAQTIPVTPAFFQSPRLLADVGGTNARFALELAPGRIEHIHVLSGAAYATLADALKAYLALPDVVAAAGLGVSLVPASMTNVRLPGIAYKPLNAKSQPALEVYCHYLKDEDSPLFHAMLRTVRAFAGTQENVG